MKVLVLGANGRLGRRIVGGLLGRGHAVRAFIHHHHHLAPHAQLELFSGDVHDGAAVTQAVQGVDAVVSALSSAAAPLKDVTSSAMRNLIPAMTAAGVRRLVSVTGSAVCRDHERDSPHPYLAARREQLMRIIPELVIDGEAHIRVLERSEMDWTVIRAPLMHDESAADYALSPDPPPPQTSATYLSVAAAMIDQITSDEWLGAAPFARLGGTA